MSYAMMVAEDAKGDITTERAYSGACLSRDVPSCDECWLEGVPLKRCQCCKVAKYCSTECQKKAWNWELFGGHKKTCKQLRNCGTYVPVAGTGAGLVKFSARQLFHAGVTTGVFSAPPGPQALPAVPLTSDGFSVLSDPQVSACLARLGRAEHPKLCLVSRRVRSLVRATEGGLVAARRRCPLTHRDLTEPMVVMVGGEGTDLNLHSHVTMLDDRGKWIALKRYPKPVGAQRNVVLGGEIYSMGGMHAPMLNRTPRGASECVFKPHAGRACACVMVYNPLHNRWRGVTPMLHPRLAFGAVTEAGKIYVFGGAQRMTMDRGDVAKLCEAYDPATQTWRQLANIPEPLEGPAVVAVDGTIYLLGGQRNPAGTTEAAVQSYNVAKNKWTRHRPMPEPRKAFSAFVVGRKILCMGGIGVDQQSTATTYCLDTTTMKWSRLADAPEVHCGFFVHVGDRLCSIDVENCESDYIISEDAWVPDRKLAALPIWHKVHMVEPVALSLAI